MAYFLDFEASSILPGSFPIEVAWVDQDGRGETCLIRPAPGWLSPSRWQWDPVSASIHGITLGVLEHEGEDARMVARRLAEAVGGVPVYSDAPSYDGHWLAMLLDQGGMEGAVSLSNVRDAYGMACLPLFERLPKSEGIMKSARWAMETMRMRQVVSAAEDEEAERPRVHRALPDAMALWRTWRDIQDRVAVIVGREGTGCSTHPHRH